MTGQTVVQKFGGTSVGTAERLAQVTEIIKASDAETSALTVVLSAMSSHKKTEGTTSRLLEAAAEVLTPDSTRYLDIIDGIAQFHLDVVAEATGNETLKSQVSAQIQAECERLRSFMAAAEIIDEISPRSRDVIISTGEKLSARILTAKLLDSGLKAQYVSLDKLVTEKFDSKAVIDQKFYDYLTNKLKELFAKMNQKDTIAVVTGFMGPIPGSVLSTIGRGYTDLTAALIAVATKADELQIWKEVDGIFTADPRKVPAARLLARISPEETAELTYYGSEVIHPFTMEQVIRASIPIRIKNTFAPSGRGSLIVPSNYAPTPSADGHDASLSSSPKHPTAVTIKEGVTVVNVLSNRKSVSHGFFEKIFSILDTHGIIVDLISTSQVNISMALGPHVRSSRLDAAIQDLKKYGTVDVSRDLAILSLVGKEMRNMVGIASRMFSTLAEHSVNLEMISQGASEINISCVIQQEQADLALRAVHENCIARLSGSSA